MDDVGFTLIDSIFLNGQTKYFLFVISTKVIVDWLRGDDESWFKDGLSDVWIYLLS